jgi:hypothetical protein
LARPAGGRALATACRTDALRIGLHRCRSPRGKTVGENLTVVAIFLLAPKILLCSLGCSTAWSIYTACDLPETAFRSLLSD